MAIYIDENCSLVNKANKKDGFMPSAWFGVSIEIVDLNLNTADTLSFNIKKALI